MKKVILILITIFSIFSISSCNKSTSNITSTEFLDFNNIKLKGYNNEVTYEVFISLFQDKVKESYSILENDFIIAEDKYSCEKIYKDNLEYIKFDEISYSMDGKYDNDTKILERKNKTSKTYQYKEVSFNDKVTEGHYQNIEKKDKLYELDLLDNSYQITNDNITSTINYLYNTIFNTKYDFQQYNINYDNHDVNYDYVNYYIDDNIFTVIYDNKNSTYYNKKDYYQIEFNNDSVLLDINLYMEMNEYGQKQETYKLHAEIKNKELNLKSKLPSKNSTITENDIKEIEENYINQNGYEMDVKPEDVLGCVNGYIIYFMRTELTALDIKCIDGVYFGSSSSCAIYGYKNEEFIDLFDLYEKYEYLSLNDLIKISERYYLKCINIYGEIEEWYFGIGSSMIHDHLAHNAWT